MTFLLVWFLLSGGSVYGAGLALPDGQLAGPDLFHAPSIDVALGTGDEFQYAGARIGMSLSAIRVFAEVSRREQELDDIAIRGMVDAEANSTGIGLFAPLPSWSDQIRTSLRVVANRADFEITSPLAVSGQEASVDDRRFSVAVDARFNSMRALTGPGLAVFGGVGLEWRRDELETKVGGSRDSRLDDRTTDVVPRFSLGVAYSIGSVDIVAMVEEVDGAALYLGLRLGRKE